MLRSNGMGTIAILHNLASETLSLSLYYREQDVWILLGSKRTLLARSLESEVA